MKNRLHKLIALGILTVLTISTVAFTSQDALYGAGTVIAAEDGADEDEDDLIAAAQSEEEAAAAAAAAEAAAQAEAEAAAQSEAEAAAAAAEAAAQSEAEAAAAAEAAAQAEAEAAAAAAAAEDVGIVSSDMESEAAAAEVVGDEIEILEVYNEETVVVPDAEETLVVEAAAEAAAAEQAAEAQVETEPAAEETETETESETETETEEEEDEDEVAANIVGFSVNPSAYPAADASENTRYIYNYLTTTMGFNHAAACGVLANIQMESGFNPLALGDGGTSYGICQWHNDRFNSLISYCNSIGLDYNTLDGQLANLNRELSGGYSSIKSYIMGVPDTQQGAYDAGYYWCVYFEIPNDATSHGALRGNLAANEYYPLDLSMKTATTETEEMPVEDGIFLLQEDMALQSDGWAVNTEEDSSVIFSFPEVLLVNQAE